jgi:hypothetical protein
MHNYKPLKVKQSLCEYSKHRDDVNIGFCNRHIYEYRSVKMIYKGKGKVTPLQARCGPEGG